MTATKPTDSKGVRITVEDLDGEQPTAVIEIAHTYFVVEHGDCYIDGFQTYANGTHVVTFKKAKGPRARSVEVDLAAGKDGGG